jgi:hypothetical protein
MKNLLLTLTLVLVVASAGCTKQPDLEKVPIGTKVEVTRQDGGVVSGKLAARDEKGAKITAGSTSRLVPRSEIVAVRLPDQTTDPLPETAKFREFTIPDGTKLQVRLESPVGSDSSAVEDPVEATLTGAVSVDGTEVLPAGSLVRGAVSAVESSGKAKGRGTLTLLFSSVSVAGSDQRYKIAARAAFLAPSGKNKDIATVGVPAAGGAILGAIIGGGKGAVVGGVVGGGAGAAVVLTTRGPQIHLPRGTALSLPLDAAVDIRVPITKR